MQQEVQIQGGLNVCPCEIENPCAEAMREMAREQQKDIDFYKPCTGKGKKRKRKPKTFELEEEEGAIPEEEVEEEEEGRMIIKRKHAKPEKDPCAPYRKQGLKKRSLNWWESTFVQYAFRNPYVKARLEKLVEMNLVKLSDRGFMSKLMDRIKEDIFDSMKKRMKAREFEETERIKELVLNGLIPFSQAPESMATHPIMIIEEYCARANVVRRAKIRVAKVNIADIMYFDDTPDPPSGLAIENGHAYRPGTDPLCKPVERFVDPSDLMNLGDGKAKKPEPKAAGKGAPKLPPYMYSEADFNWLKYESPEIKSLKQCETVEEMYSMADEIVGDLQTMKAAVRLEEGEVEGADEPAEVEEGGGGEEEE